MITTLKRILLLIIIVLLNIRPSFALEEKLIAGDGDIRHRFGTSVEIDSTMILVGAPGTFSDGDYRGAVYIYEYYEYEDSTAAWIETQKLEMSDDGPLDLFGFSIAKSDSFIIVGARGDSLKNPFGGAAFIFTQDEDGVWTQSQKLETNQIVPADMFGFSVDIDGEYAVVGAPRAGGLMRTSGSAFIYRVVDHEWTLDTKLAPLVGRIFDNFGCSVALSGNQLIVGASGLETVGNWVNPKAARTGTAFIFERDQNEWRQVDMLVPVDGNVNNMFGFSVDMDSHYAVIGAYKDDVLDFDTGSAYIYKKDATGWIQDIKLTALDADSGDYFGAAVSIRKDYIVIGAPGVDGFGKNWGAVYSYLLGDEGWAQRAKKTPYDAARHDAFGASISSSYELTVIGAPHKKVEEKTSQGVAYIYDNIGDLALPVELSLFTATLEKGAVLIQWTTQSEKDNLGFILERRDVNSGWRVFASFQTHDELRGQGSKSMPTHYAFVDDSIETNMTYSYRIADVNLNGIVTFHDPVSCSIPAGVEARAIQPGSFAVYPAFPNPFNPRTILRYDVNKPCYMSIRVYDVTGRERGILLDNRLQPGHYSHTWDGTDGSGRRLSSGVYFIQFQSEHSHHLEKVMLMQ